MSKSKLPPREQARDKKGKYDTMPTRVAEAPTSAPALLKNIGNTILETNKVTNDLAEIYARFKEKHGRAPVIGLDLDGTTADMVAGFRPRVAEARGISQAEATTHLPDPDDYAFSQSTTPWFKDRAEFLEHFQAAEKTGLYRDLPVYEGAINVLQTLADEGFEIRAVTARSADYNPDTSHWLDSQGIPYKEIVNPGFEKHTVEGVDLFIDDAPHVIQKLVDKERKVIIFTQEYNDHHNIDSDEHTRRITKWSLGTVSEAIGDLL